MRSSMAERALGLVVTALLLVGPVACRDDKPAASTGGTAGTAGSAATGGSAGSAGPDGGDMAAPADGGGDLAAVEGGVQDVAMDLPAGDGGTAVMRSFYTHP